MLLLTRYVVTTPVGIGCTIVIIFLSDATDVGAVERTTIDVSEGNSQHRGSSHRGKVEDKNTGELHDGIAG